MQKWDYCIVLWQGPTTDQDGNIESVANIIINTLTGSTSYEGEDAKLLRHLTELGEEGWEAVNLAETLPITSLKMTVLLKRPRQD